MQNRNNFNKKNILTKSVKLISYLFYHYHILFHSFLLSKSIIF